MSNAYIITTREYPFKKWAIGPIQATSGQCRASIYELSDFYFAWGVLGLRFQKRIKIANGLWLNVSGDGVSLSTGTPGATVS